MLKLKDKQFEGVLSAIFPFVMGELEEITPFGTKSDEQREEILKVATKSVEVAVIIFGRLLKDEALDTDLLQQVTSLIKQQKFNDATELLNIHSS